MYITIHTQIDHWHLNEKVCIYSRTYSWQPSPRATCVTGGKLQCTVEVGRAEVAMSAKGSVNCSHWHAALA